MSEEVKNDSVEAKTDEVSSPVASDEASKETTAAAEVETKEEAKAEVPAEFKDLIEKVEKMSVLELHSLVKVLEAHFGVSAQAVAVAGPAAAGGGAEEKDEFTVELSDAGAQKIAVIKVVKEALNLGLKEAKDMVDAAPSVVKEAMKKEDAEALKAKLEEAGAKVTLK